jgi:hypothetical protein
MRSNAVTKNTQSVGRHFKAGRFIATAIDFGRSDRWLMKTNKSIDNHLAIDLVLVTIATVCKRLSCVFVLREDLAATCIRQGDLVGNNL